MKYTTLVLAACLLFTLIKGVSAGSDNSNRVEGRPRVQEVLPRAEQARPVVLEARLKVQEARPRVQQVRPKVQELRPKADEVRPKAEEARPKVEETQPKAEEVVVKPSPVFDPFKYSSIQRDYRSFYLRKFDELPDDPTYVGNKKKGKAC